MIIRPERSEDPAETAAVHAVVGAAFGGDRVPALLEAMRADSCWRGLSFVAEEGGAVVGHVAFTRGWVDTSDFREVLVLSPMSVHPDAQHRGVGSALVREALEALQGRPEPVVFLEGSPRYYPRFGFVPAETLGFTSPSRFIPQPAFQALPLPSYAPGLTGALVYPDVFWRYGAVGLRD